VVRVLPDCDPLLVLVAPFLSVAILTCFFMKHLLDYPAPTIVAATTRMNIKK
jgi:hypothetical protein